MIVHNVKEGEVKEEQALIDTLETILKIEDTKTKYMELVPIITEDYRAWNYLKDEPTESQLRLTELAIENNPKSYQAWYHRLFIFRQNPDLILRQIEREKQLLDLLLEFDSRNFHCWNYKASIVHILRFAKVNYKEGNSIKERCKEGNLSKVNYKEDNLLKVNYKEDDPLVKSHKEGNIINHISDINNIGKSITNYSYVHSQGGFDPCAAVFTDPYDDCVWMYYTLQRETYLLRKSFYLRRYNDRLEIHFKDAFSGDLHITMASHLKVHKVEYPTKIYTVNCNEHLNDTTITVNQKCLNKITMSPPISLKNKHLLSDQSLFLSNSIFLEIQRLDPDCVMNFFFNINNLEQTEKVIEILKREDPIRKNYYDNIQSDLYLIYL